MRHDDKTACISPYSVDQISYKILLAYKLRHPKKLDLALRL